MSVLFDMGAFFEYYSYCKAENSVKIDFNKAMKGFNVQKEVDKIGEENKTDEIIYVVPSITGNKGILEIKGKKFWQA